MAQSPVSFAADIRPLFRQVDIDHMRPLNVFLDDYGFMSKPENAVMVHDFLSGKKQPQMPPDKPWPAENVALFAGWMAAGYPE
jgi:hypothetical protein